MAHDVAAPLVDYIRSQLIDQDKSAAPAFTFMVGHDSNIASLLAALKVKPYQLPGQYEQTPIGGQVVFERWHDNKTNKDLLKIEYVYQSTEQLRDADTLSLAHPPERVTLQLTGCPIDSNGYCSWSDFTNVLNDALLGTVMQPHMAPTEPVAATNTPPAAAVPATSGSAVTGNAASSGPKDVAPDAAASPSKGKSAEDNGHSPSGDKNGGGAGAGHSASR